jgi:hypothetical protein
MAIERQAPAIFANARANLAETQAKPYVETAIEVATGSESFLRKDLAAALNSSATARRQSACCAR